MCYTATDSLMAYFINFISSVILYNLSEDIEYKVISLFLLFVGQMQLFDYLFWKNQECNENNKLTTQMAIIFNHLQPIVLFLLQYYYGFRQTALATIIIILYGFYSIDYTTQALREVECTLPDNNKMDWKWNRLNNATLYYSLFLGYLVIAGFNFTEKSTQILFALISSITFIVATKTPILNYSVGRIWCYYASLMPVLILFVRRYFH
jgi:hypothetical protein